MNFIVSEKKSAASHKLTCRIFLIKKDFIVDDAIEKLFFNPLVPDVL